MIAHAVAQIQWWEILLAMLAAVTVIVAAVEWLDARARRNADAWARMPGATR